MKNLEGETLTTEDISHNLNIDYEQAKVLASAPALLEALETVSRELYAGGHAFRCSADVIKDSLCVCGRDAARVAIEAAKGDAS